MDISRQMKAEQRPNSNERNRNKENNILQFPAAKKLTIYAKRHKTQIEYPAKEASRRDHVKLESCQLTP